MEKAFMADLLSVTVLDSRKEMGAYAAAEGVAELKKLLQKKPFLNVMFAAAPSQNEVLAGLCETSEVDFSRIHAFHMDEYVGLSSDAPQGFGNFLRDRLFGKRPFQSVHYIGTASGGDPEKTARAYGELLANSPLDLCFMGIGENGHIAFNDPSVADFADPHRVKVVMLDGKCRRQQVNDGCFAALSEVPEKAITVTIPALMSADRIICTVPAATKAEAVLNAVRGPVSTACPASILRTHPAAKLFLDSDSARLLCE